jgi:hypothetical protein
VVSLINNFAFVIHTPQNQLNDAQHELVIVVEHQQNNLLVLVKQSQIQPSEEPQLRSLE